jgi:hypothetical protein
LRWWERDEDGGRCRYERELEALLRAGRDPRPDADPVSGLLRIHVRATLRGQVHTLTIVYPHRFPYFRFEIFASPSLAYRRHQSPDSGALCVLDQGGANWSPSMLAADVLDEQLRKLEAANDASGPYAGEVPAPEPVSMYFDYANDSLLILPREAYAIPADHARGRMIVALTSMAPLRGFVERVDEAAATLPDLSRALPLRERIACDWVRVPAPTSGNPRTVAAALAASGHLRRPMATSSRAPFDVVALLFEEEVEYRDVMGPGWAVLVRRPTPQGWVAELIRTEWYEPQTQAARIAPIAALSTMTVVQFGCGGLGAPAAHLLAQSRLGRLRLVDGDRFILGNAVRAPQGWAFAGFAKVDALRALIQANYPETQVDAFGWFVGRSVSAETGVPVPDEDALIDAVFAGADLVLDATADIGVQQFLAAECRKRGLRYVMVEATPGGFGGIVAIVHPDRAKPCWLCLQLAIEEQLVRPPLDAGAGMLQLQGCSTPTFTGAAFDLIPLSALAVRLVALALCASETYPLPAWDVAVLSNREGDDGVVGMTPRWSFLQLQVNPRCTEDHSGV